MEIVAAGVSLADGLRLHAGCLWPRRRLVNVIIMVREIVSPEGTFCDTIQVPSGAGDMQLIK